MVWDFYVHLDPIYLSMCSVEILAAHPIYIEWTILIHPVKYLENQARERKIF